MTYLYDYDAPSYTLGEWVTGMAATPDVQLQVAAQYDGDRELGAYYLFQPQSDEAATESLEYGCSVDQAAQDFPTVPNGTVTPVAVPLDVPYPGQ